MTTHSSTLTYTHSILEHSLAYLQQQWGLVFMESGSKGPNHEGWNAPSEIATTPESAVLRLQHGPMNVGLVHDASGTVALDIDDVESTRLIWAELGIDYDEVMGSGMRIRSNKANRDKVIFLAPIIDGVRAKLPLKKINWPTKGAVKVNDRSSVFELRSGPNQDVLPPSLHPDGHHYEWVSGRAPWDFEVLPTLPDAVLQFWLAMADGKSGVAESVQAMCPWRAPTLGVKPVMRSRAASTEHGDVIGKFNVSNDVGDLLEQHGYRKIGRRYLAPSASTKIPGVVVLDGDKVYSHHGSDVLADGYAHDAFGLHLILGHSGDMSAAIKDAAAQLGVERDARPVANMDAEIEAMIAASAARAASAAIQQAQTTAALAATAKPTPSHLLNPPGAMGEFVTWVMRRSPMPQRELAVAASIALFGTLLGRKVATESGSRTNFYVLGVAGTGMGKDAARKCIKHLLGLVGQGEKLGEEAASGAAVAGFVHRSPASLYLIDEIGMMLQSAAGKSGNAHVKDAIRTLMVLWSSSDSRYIGKDYANATDRPRQDIDYPCLSLYGTTTPSQLYEALTAGDAASGWLNRMLVINAPETMPVYQETTPIEPPDALVAWARASAAISIGLAGADPAQPILVPCDPIAATVMSQFRTQVRGIVQGYNLTRNDTSAALWGRAAEMAGKLAVIVAVASVPANKLPNSGKPGEQPLEVGPSHAQWACDYVRTALEAMESAVRGNVAESDADRVVVQIRGAIERAGVSGRSMAELRAFSRAFRALGDVSKQMAALKVLEVDGDVIHVQSKSVSGRITSRWFHKSVSANNMLAEE